MPEDIQDQNQEEQKEVTSTQTTIAESQELKEKYAQLPLVEVKPSSNFKLFSFTGDNSRVKIATYIKVYENLAERSGWSKDEMKWNLISYLEEDAFEYYVLRILSNKDLDWEQVKKEMLRRFEKYEYTPLIEFLNYKWIPRIGLKGNLIKIRGLGLDANISELEIVNNLNKHLPVHYKEHFSGATTLEGWAWAAESAIKSIPKSHHTPTWKNGRRGGHRQTKIAINKLEAENMTLKQNLLANQTKQPQNPGQRETVPQISV